MRPLSQKILNNLRNPLRVYDWWRYQNARPHDMDTYLITLTGAGTHWLRMMYARALTQCYALPDEILSIRPDELVPEFLVKTQRFKYNDRHYLPRVQHSHVHYNPLFKNRRIILLVRDLRDAIISHYKTHTAVHGVEMSFSDFLRGQNLDKKRTHTLQSRISFLNSWHKNSGKLDDILVLTFEDLKKSPADELEKALEFSKFDNVTKELLNDVVEFSSLENMKKLEEQKPLAQYKKKTNKIRDGKSGGYKEFFSDSDQQYFQTLTDELLIDSYGYNYKNWD